MAIVSEVTMAVLGGVLLWAQQMSVNLEAIVVEENAGPVDRWLDGFTSRPTVHTLEGRLLVEPVTPRPESTPPAPAVPSTFDIVDVEVVVESGIVMAEVRGLEVARVVVDADGTEHIEVGVGLYDRAGHKVMSAGRPVADTLADVVARVAELRRPAASAHTFNRLCRERWMRTMLVAEPALVDLVDLHPVEPLPPRVSLLDAGPAPALGTDGHGSTVLLMASAGVDPGLPVSTAAIAQREGPDRIVVALPDRDRLDPVRRLLTRLRWPVEMVGIDPPWSESVRST